MRSFSGRPGASTAVNRRATSNRSPPVRITRNVRRQGRRCHFRPGTNGFNGDTDLPPATADTVGPLSDYTSSMNTHGFLRVAAACPDLRVADCPFNADRTLALLQQAEDAGRQPRRLPRDGADRLHLPRPVPPPAAPARRRGGAGAAWSTQGAKVFRGVAVVGLPLVGRRAALQLRRRDPRRQGARRRPQDVPAELQGVLRRPLLRPGRQRRRHRPSRVAGQSVPFGTDLLFDCRNVPGFVARRRDLRGPVDAGAAEFARRRSPGRPCSPTCRPATR